MGISISVNSCLREITYLLDASVWGKSQILRIFEKHLLKKSYWNCCFPISICCLWYTVTYQKYSYRPKFPSRSFTSIYLLKKVHTKWGFNKAIMTKWYLKINNFTKIFIFKLIKVLNWTATKILIIYEFWLHIWITLSSNFLIIPIVSCWDTATFQFVPLVSQVA